MHGTGESGHSYETARESLFARPVRLVAESDYSHPDDFEWFVVGSLVWIPAVRLNEPLAAVKVAKMSSPRAVFPWMLVVLLAAMMVATPASSAPPEHAKSSVTASDLDCEIPEGCVDGIEIVDGSVGAADIATGAVAFSDLSGIPAGLADGDDDTQYQAGTGLQSFGTEFSVDVGTVQARVLGTCEVGSAVRAVDVQGNVTCETIGTGPTLDGLAGFRCPLGSFVAGFTGTDPIEPVCVADGGGEPPVVIDQQLSTPRDTPLAIGPAGPGDPDGDPLVLEVASAPQRGTAVADLYEPSILYTPGPGYWGPDSFGYRAFDGELRSDPATTAIDVGNFSTVADSNDDITSAILRALDTAPLGSTGWCQIEVTVDELDVAFTAGDTVTVTLYESDPVGDDLLFQHVESVAGAGSVVLQFGCEETPLPTEDDGFVEVYLEVEVDKAACGFGCADDRVVTGELTIQIDSPLS